MRSCIVFGAHAVSCLEFSIDEPMLQKNATSQLTLLTDEEYSAGIARIRTAVAQAETIGEEIVFPVDISLHMVEGLLERL